MSYIARLTSIIKRNLPLRVSLMIGSALSVLLFASLFTMFYFSRKTLKENALNRASYSLQQAMTNIDNILLSVEETAGNTYFNLRLDKPEQLDSVSARMMEANPYITGCAIALASGKDYEKEAWFSETVATKEAKWVRQQVEQDSVIDQFISFCLPIVVAGGNVAGVIRADVSVSLLSGIIAEARPSPNSYCALMDSDGSFIVHPMENGLLTPNGQNMSEASIKQAVSAMVSGNAGYVPFETGGHRYYLFYKPFERAEVPFRTTTNYKWSIGMAYDEHDIFGAYYRLFNWVVAITLGGIAVMYLLIRLIVLRQLRSLEMLTRHAGRIAQGHYNEPIPTTPKIDELGVLQDNFLRMQQSISAHIDKLNELSNAIKQRGRELKAAYKQARQAEKMKTGFLHNMTDQMIQPAFNIAENVTALCGDDGKKGEPTTNNLVEKIEQDGTTITQLLNNLLDVSEREMDEEKGGEA